MEIATSILMTLMIVAIIILSIVSYNLYKKSNQVPQKKEPKVVTYITDNETGRTTLYDPNSHITIKDCKVTVNNILTNMDKLKELQDVKRLELDDPLSTDESYLNQVALEYEKLKRDLKI